VATPGFSASRTQVPLGSPLDLTYRFEVSSDAPSLPEGLWVMVHFLDADGEQLWTEDHQPPVPTSAWKPGQRIEYSRTVFIPIFPYVGPVSVHMGLYSPATGERYPLAGPTPGQRSYPVANLELVPRPEDAFIIFKDGWNNAEVARDNAAIEWQWSRRQATLSFRNPQRDATFYLDLDARPDLVSAPLVVQLRIGERLIDEFTISTRDEIIRRVPIAAADFGSEEFVDLQLDVSETFVPAQIPSELSADPRELGIRVFHAYVEAS
jgi:hypothetical protein